MFALFPCSAVATILQVVLYVHSIRLYHIFAVLYRVANVSYKWPFLCLFKANLALFIVMHII